MRSIGIYEDAIINNIVTTDNGDYLTILEWIEQNIREDPSKKFEVETEKIKTLLGQEFKEKGDTAIISTIRRILSKYGIIIKSKLHNDGVKIKIILTMSFDPISISYENALTQRMVKTKDGKELSALNYIKQEIAHDELNISLAKIEEILGPEFKDKSKDAIRDGLRYVFGKHDMFLISKRDQYGDIYLTIYRKDYDPIEVS